MRKDTPNEKLIQAIREKVPQQARLTNLLVDILSIEKEAVYRRLRGEVPFSFAEALKIAKELNISLDSIDGNMSPKSRPFQMKLVEYDNPTETDYYMLEEYVGVLRAQKESSYSEFGAVSGVLPNFFYSHYDTLFRLFVMKWLYEFGDPNSSKKFNQIIISDRMRRINEDYLLQTQNMSYSYFILDELLFYYLANDINYFRKIKLINQEEVIQLKDEMNKLLDKMELLATKGVFENGNKIHFHVSTLHFESNYSYLQGDNIHLSLIKAYTFNEIASLDETVFNKMKTWIESLKRTSILISGSGEIERLKFFEKQRNYVESL